jgi:Mn-dependent DtxR family transcriptional regulator
MLHSIARRLALRDQEEVDRAVKLAKENGWVELEGLHRMRLTDAGRALFRSNHKR